MSCCQKNDTTVPTRKSNEENLTDAISFGNGSVTQSGGNGKVQGDSLFLYFAVVTGSLSYISFGSCLVWTSPTLLQLSSNDTTINPLQYPVTSYDASLIVGLFQFGSFVAPFFSGFLMDGLGRKNALFVFGIMNILSLVLLAFSTELVWMLVARTISGLAVGGLVVALPVFITEISDDHNRGKFGCLRSVFLPLGQLFGYSVGSILPVKLFTLACALPLILHVILIICFIPDTPVYLLHKGRREEALKSLRKFRSNKTSVEIENDLLTMEYTQEQTTKEKKAGFLSLFSHQPARRGLLISTGMAFIQMGIGIGVLLSFMGPIFEEAQTGISGNLTSILAGSLKVIVFFMVASVIERLGRKPLLFLSAFFCCISLFLLGLYFYMKEHNLGSYQSFSWLPLTSLLVFILFYSFGIGPITVTTISELFPIHIRSNAVSSLTIFMSLINVVTVSSFPIISNYIGISGCMWIFSAVGAFGVAFVYFVVPETKGKSIYEIQEMLKRRSSTPTETLSFVIQKG